MWKVENICKRIYITCIYILRKKHYNHIPILLKTFKNFRFNFKILFILKKVKIFKFLMSQKFDSPEILKFLIFIHNFYNFEISIFFKFSKFYFMIILYADFY